MEFELLLMVLAVIFLFIAWTYMAFEKIATGLFFGILMGLTGIIALATPRDLIGGGVDFGYMLLIGFITVMMFVTFVQKVTQKEKAS